jgi:hypothetical protein
VLGDMQCFNDYIQKRPTLQVAVVNDKQQNKEEEVRLILGKMTVTFLLTFVNNCPQLLAGL